MNKDPAAAITNEVNKRSSSLIPRINKSNTFNTLLPSSEISSPQVMHSESRRKLLEEIKKKFKSTVDEEIKRIDEFEN